MGLGEHAGGVATLLRRSEQTQMMRRIAAPSTQVFGPSRLVRGTSLAGPQVRHPLERCKGCVMSDRPEKVREAGERERREADSEEAEE